MASFLIVSSPQFSFRWSPLFLPSDSFSCATQLKKGLGRRLLVLPVKCLSSESGKDAESDPKTESFPSSSSPSSFSLSATNSTYKWCAGLGGIGFVETAYLTYLKLTNSVAFCPISGSTCGDVLNSDYAVVYGVPLPLIGMVAYGLVTALSLQFTRKNLPFGTNETYGRLILLGSTTSMAAASAYFLYILSTNLSGPSCYYCLMSALLSFSLFFITLKVCFSYSYIHLFDVLVIKFWWYCFITFLDDFGGLKDVGLQEAQKMVGLQLCIASLVIFTLITSYSSAQPVLPSLAAIDLHFFTTEVTTPSSPFSLSLARHLHSIGAKMYGAFWCSHCLEQKQMFGREATKLLDYVECFPDGYMKGTKMAKACADAGIEGFPSWVINGQLLSGEQELTELAERSGFSFKEASH